MPLPLNQGNYNDGEHTPSKRAQKSSHHVEIVQAPPARINRAERLRRKRGGE